MEKEYRVYGIHCSNCAEDLAEQLSSLPNGDKINYNKEEGILKLTDENIYEDAKLLVRANNGYLVDVDQTSKLDDKKEDKNHSHHHGHGHSHSHVSAGEESTRNIGIAFFLNLAFSIAEFIFGSLFNSFAILSDAVHDLGDAFSIGVAWILQKVSIKEPDHKYSDGYGRFSLLGSLFTGLVLIAGSVTMVILSIPRIFNPEPVNYTGMFWLAIVAILINGYAGYLMYKGSSKNEKMLSFHMLEDILGWLAVLIVSIVLRFVDWYVLDPILSLAIATFILYKTVPEFINSSRIFMNVAPEDVDMEKLKDEILGLDHIHGISNLHTHSIDGVENVFSATLFVDTEDMEKIEEIKDQVRLLLIERDIVNTTIEVVPDVKRIVG